MDFYLEAKNRQVIYFILFSSLSVSLSVFLFPSCSLFFFNLFFIPVNINLFILIGG